MERREPGWNVRKLHHAERRAGTMERAFQLARSGGCSSLAEIGERLSGEGYDDALECLCGLPTRAQLARIIAEARAPVLVPLRRALPGTTSFERR